jgi:hypothetical protein
LAPYETRQHRLVQRVSNLELGVGHADGLRLSKTDGV